MKYCIEGGVIQGEEEEQNDTLFYISGDHTLVQLFLCLCFLYAF